MSGTKETVKHLLKKARVTKPPIPVERLAELHGLDIRLAPYDGDLSGALIRTEEEAYIGVNSSHHPNRQRFTIAHELAHFFLHKGMRVHIDKEFWINLRNQDSSKALKWEEIEANRFAAELLMPTEFIIKDINKLKRLDSQAVQRLARRYKVSSQAMEIKLVNLGLVLSD